MQNYNYYTLALKDPPIQYDSGAGAWNSKRKTVEIIAAKNEILKHLHFAIPVIGDVAVKHMYHYFANSGQTMSIDVQRMIEEVPDGKRIYNDQLLKVKEFVAYLTPGEHQIAPLRPEIGANPKSENWNWFYAVGAYRAWINGIVKIAAVKNGQRQYRLNYHYRVADKYNWDQDKCVEIFGVPIKDEFMDEFHRQGLAREFKMSGEIKGAITWDSNDPSSNHTVVPAAPQGRSF
jgi:hypothetical protein